MALTSLYKTPEEYLAVAIERIQASGSKLTDFHEGSVTRTFYEGHAAMLSQQSAVVDQLREDSYLATATGEALDAKAGDYSVFRKPAVAATGTIRIERVGQASALTIPAGWGQLATAPTPGQPSIAYVTLEEASFAGNVGTEIVTVLAEAATGGVEANNDQGPAAETPLFPVNPIATIDSATGFVLYGPMADGVDEETDEQLRDRVPIDVAGRVKGRRESFLAAALRVPGVTSAQVLGPGDTRANATVLVAPTIEVYHDGGVSLDGAVTAEVLAATMLGQQPDVINATVKDAVVDVEVFTNPGIDTVVLGQQVEDALIALIDSVGVGETGRYSAAVTTLHDLGAVIAVDLPFSDFRLSTGVDNTAADIIPLAGCVLRLTAANCAVTVTVLT